MEVAQRRERRRHSAELRARVLHASAAPGASVVYRAAHRPERLLVLLQQGPGNRAPGHRPDFHGSGYGVRATRFQGRESGWRSGVQVQPRESGGILGEYLRSLPGKDPAGEGTSELLANPPPSAKTTSPAKAGVVVCGGKDRPCGLSARGMRRAGHVGG
jgi:hypothetical protein